MHEVTDRLPKYKKLFSLFNPMWAGNIISHIQIKQNSGVWEKTARGDKLKAMGRNRRMLHKPIKSSMCIVLFIVLVYCTIQCSYVL
jgi:hypothetical protein